MSLNVLNKKFLSLLCQLGIDIDAFPDKTFDGLFQRRQNDLKHFLEWFVHNITPENALTEAEVDIYLYLKACNLCLTDAELDFALSKLTPSYEDFMVVDDNYIDILAGEVREINKEYEKLKSINFELESKYSELKKKPNHLKEECNKTRKKLEQVKEKLQLLNVNFSTITEDVNSFQLSSFTDVFNLTKFKNCAEEEEKWTEKFISENVQCEKENELISAATEDMLKLKLNFTISKYCSLVSESLLHEAKHKALRAEEFLNKLQSESESHFTFDEVFCVLFDLNELLTHDELLEKTNCLQMGDLMDNLDKECELIWHNFLGSSYHAKLCDNNGKIAKYSVFLKHLKLDIINNLALQRIANRSKEKTRELASMINGFYSFVNKNQIAVRNAIENMEYKNKRSHDYFRNLNEKHALLLSCKRNAKNFENVSTFNKDCAVIKSLFDSMCFYREEFVNNLESGITSKISNVLSGPTSEIKMTPVEIEAEFSKCDHLIAKNSRSIQRLLTEYVNDKESILSSNRRQLLLWTDFLVNPDVLVAGLERLQEKSIECASKLSDF